MKHRSPSWSPNGREHHQGETLSKHAHRNPLRRLLARLCRNSAPGFDILSPHEVREQVHRARERAFRPNPKIPERGLEYADQYSVPQEMQFVIDCLPTLTALLKGYERGAIVRLLDFGPGFGAGSNLIATLFRSNFLWCRVEVDALDIKDLRQDVATIDYPLVHYRTGQLEDLDPDTQWDIVFCSNVIEHTDNPGALIQALRARCRDWLILYAPYREEELSLGHHSRIDETTFKPFAPVRLEIKASLAWNVRPDDRQILAVIKGTG